jgi:exodeoxyribonuclease V alpha subunit
VVRYKWREKLEQLDKLIVTINYIRTFNEDNGFVVFNGTDFETGKPTNVKGNSFSLNEGDILECEGRWLNDPKWGMQFDAKTIQLYTPTTPQTVLSYLESGYIRGIRKKTAANIFAMFGEKSIEILDQDPDQLKNVKGIGEKTLEKIIEDWNEKRVLHKQNESLKELGFSIEEALKISKTLGGEAIKTLCEMPYALVTEPEFDFSFDKIDKIALTKLRFQPTNPARILTYIIYLLKKAEGRGNTYLDKEVLFNEGLKKLKIDKEDFELSYLAGLKFKKIIENEKENITIVQKKSTYNAEMFIATKIKQILEGNGKVFFSPELKIDDATERGFVLSEGQKGAIIKSLENKVCIINGGPGVGKTTALNTLIKMIKKQHMTFTLCAPTGKAAQRMSESTNEEANTIHKTLEYNPPMKAFQKNEINPIDTDFVIIDETSMVDVFLFRDLLKAIPNSSTLILIGDVNQIPSIAAGKVLKDLIESEKIPTAFITELQRQAKDSDIINNAYLVNEGKFIKVNNKKDGDFFFIKTSSDFNTLEKIKEMVKNNIPKAFKVNPKYSLQTLTPIHEKTLGRKSLNKELQNILNEESDLIKRGEIEFRRNDNIMQTKNNYDKEVFNGDSGEILSIGRNQIDVTYNGKIVNYERTDFDQLELSYAITMHKSQGSEYPLIIIPISSDYSGILDRSLLYTAITRGKERVIIIGSERRLKEAIKNDFSRRRKTYLREILIEKLK